MYQKPIEELFITGVIPINQGNQFYAVLSDQTIQLLQPNSEIFSSKSEFIQIQEYIAGNHGTVADLCLVTKNKDCIALATNSQV